MKSTTDYQIFKKIACNRKIDDPNLQRIVKSIKSNNLLKYRPILIDREMGVIDGQHRLEAAKVLNLPIFYEFADDVSVDDLCRLNDNQARWNLEDWLHFYKERGVDDYRMLDDFCRKNSLSLKAAMGYLTSSLQRSKSSPFKSGKFKFPDQEKMEKINILLENSKELKEYVKEKTIGFKAYLNSANFNVAFSQFFSLSIVDFKLFMKNLELRIDLWGARTRMCAYIYMFKIIYNFRNRNPIEINESEDLAKLN
jgi:hypothetical protein